MNEGPGPKSRVLVTGATGFIGSHLAGALLRRGAEVFCLLCDHDPRSPLHLSGDIERVRVVDGRLEDFDLVRRAVFAGEVDTVFHLGAQAIVGTAQRDPLTTFETNIRGTYNLLEACRLARSRVRRIVIASSDKAYGDCDALPCTEDAPLVGRFPYDVSKSCADLLAQSSAATYGLPVAIARCGNVYGPGDLNFSRLVPGAIRSLLHDERPVIRSDGSPLRDYLYVDDAVDGLLALAAWLDEAPDDVPPSRRAFNFGASRPLTVLEMVRVIRTATGREELEPLIEGVAECEIAAQHLDSTRARRELGWEAQRALPEAMARTVKWYRRYLNRFEPAPSAAAPTPASAAIAKGGAQ